MSLDLVSHSYIAMPGWQAAKFGTGLGEMKTSSSFTKYSGVPRLRDNLLPKECCLTCKMPFLSSPASQEMTPGAGQQHHPPLLPSRAAEEGAWSLGPSQSVSGCWWLFLSGKEQICSCSWFWNKEYVQFPTRHQSLSLEHGTPMVEQLWKTFI